MSGLLPQPPGAPAVLPLSAAGAAAAVCVVVDDDPAICTAIARLLGVHGVAVRAFGSAGEFLASGALHDADCVVLDVCLPDLDGLALQAQLAAAGDDVSVLFITGRGDVPSTVRAMKAGAVDFLTKPLDGPALLGAVRTACARTADRRRARATRADAERRWASLSGREREVVLGVLAGRLNKQVAADLGITEATVKQYRGSAMRKLCVASVPEALQLALTLGRAPAGRAAASPAADGTPSD